MADDNQICVYTSSVSGSSKVSGLYCNQLAIQCLFIHVSVHRNLGWFEHEVRTATGTDVAADQEVSATGTPIHVVIPCSVSRRQGCAGLAGLVQIMDDIPG